MFSNRSIGLRSLFYLVTPEESQFEKLSDVPNYFNDAMPWLFVFFLIQGIVLIFKRPPEASPLRMNDLITSLSTSILHQLFGRLILQRVELRVYVWLYSHFHLFDLPWNSSWTWFAGFLGVDCAYYWFHRMSHEIAILWASHQIHHSSEDCNLSSAVRESIVAPITSFLFFLPMALVGIPPTVFIVHFSFNVLFQFWVHTELIRNLGPLEIVINTPAHHRVHHGRNPYCIDKNFCGILTIWDRMFGTFQDEKESEPVVFGLIGNVRSFNPLYLQFFDFYNLFVEVYPRMTTTGDRLKAIFFPPGWESGRSRKPKVEEYPEVECPMIKYDPCIPRYYDLYILVHFLIVLGQFMNVTDNFHSLSGADVATSIIFIVFSVQCFGMLFDAKWYGPMAEWVRCVTTVVYLVVFVDVGTLKSAMVVVLFGASAAVWTLNMVAKHT